MNRPSGFFAMRYSIFLSLLLVPLAFCSVHGQSMEETRRGIVQGRVVDARTGEPLMGAVISLIDRSLGAYADSAGNYSIGDLEAGAYSLECSFIGFDTERVEGVVIGEDEVVEQDSKVEIGPGWVVELDFKLVERPIRLSEMTVTPGRFAIMGKDPNTRKALTHEEIQNVSQFGEDIYRAVTRLPGISSNDFSAKFTVRGGEQEEVLVLLDGLELYEPFHLKDINGGALSIIDVVAIEGIDLMTGGFPVEYGDRMSGVFDIRSTTAEAGKRRHSVGISFMNTRVMSEGAFDKGAWLVSARRGYLDLVMRLMDEDDNISPTYYDVLSKVEYQLHPGHRLSAHFLHADDHFEFVEDDDDEDETGYGNTYGWLNLKSFFGPSLFAQTVLSVGQVSHDRWGLALTDDRELRDFTVSDQRDFTFFGLKQDWSWELSERHYLKWGMNLKRLEANYDYLSTKNRYFRISANELGVRTDTTANDMTPAGNQFGFYAADRFRIARSLTAEAGLRYDRVSHTDDQLFSPRLNLVYTLGENSSVRGGLGRFYQSEGIHEVRVQDGEETFFPAQLAEHWVAGFEHYFKNDVHLRLEGYYKEISDQRPTYRNWRNQIEIFPELQHDRFQVFLEGTISKGIEVYLKRDAGGKFTWWASYALAKVEDEVSHIVIGEGLFPFGDKMPGLSDQRHTFYLDVNYRPSAKWRLNAAWQYRSGWPYTERVLRRETADGNTYYYTSINANEPYALRYPAFHRIDLRINRHFNTSRGRVSAFIEVVNLYNHGNVQSYEYMIRCSDSYECRLDREPEYWFRLLPSIGISWSWDT